MALVLNEEQTLIRDTARDFCTRNAPVEQLRKLRDSRNADGFDRPTWQRMVELGWSGIIVPEADGGSGYGWQELGVIVEEAGRTLTASPLFATVGIGASALLLGGSAAQRASLLPGIIDGSRLFALALEESAHHAPHHCATRATAAGAGWTLSGSKVFVLDGGCADTLIVTARTAGEPGQRDGITLFLVDATAAGVSRTRLTTADSRNVANIRLDGVAVGSDAVLGTVGAGADLLDGILDRARILLAAEMLGAMDEAFTRTVAYLKERKQFGQVIGSFQALKHRAADLFCEIELTRSVVREALTVLDGGDATEIAKIASLAKYKAAETMNRASNEAVQMHGGIGMTDEFEIGFFMKRARTVEMAFGDAAWHRNRWATLEGF